VTSTAALLLEADKLRPRSQQIEPGLSELGSCRRKVGYKLAGTLPVNASGNIQAVIGSAVHDRVAEILRAQAPPGWLVEHRVSLAGVPGTLDRYEADKALVVDLKTTSTRWMDHIRLHGPDDGHLWQVNCYGAALALAGHPVARVRIDYLCRDSGEEYQWPDETGAPFDVRHVRDALAWLALVRDTPLDMLPRDYEPDSVFCGSCPYGGPDGGICWEGHIPGKDLRTVLYLEDPDLPKWLGDLWHARQDKKDAAARESRAKAALTAVHPGIPNQPVGADGWAIAWSTADALRFVATPHGAAT